MTTRRKNADLNTMAHAIVAEAVGDQPKTERKVGNVWVESGRVGGQRRAANMTPEARRESAQKALAARWGGKKAASY